MWILAIHKKLSHLCWKHYTDNNTKEKQGISLLNTPFKTSHSQNSAEEMLAKKHCYAIQFGGVRATGKTEASHHQSHKPKQWSRLWDHKYTRSHGVDVLVPLIVFISRESHCALAISRITCSEISERMNVVSPCCFTCLPALDWALWNLHERWRSYSETEVDW